MKYKSIFITIIAAAAVLAGGCSKFLDVHPKGEKINMFGESHIEEIASEHNINMIAKMPINQKVAAACDKGMIELFDGDWLDGIAEMLGKTLETE